MTDIRGAFGNTASEEITEFAEKEADEIFRKCTIPQIREKLQNLG